MKYPLYPLSYIHLALLVILVGADIKIAQATPPLPPMPPATGSPLSYWNFNDTNWLTSLGNSPLSFTNLLNVPSWNGNAVEIDHEQPAGIQYRIIESSGHTNLTLNTGSLRFWFKPNWSSTNLGGTGPGNFARLIDIGAYTTNATYGWWGLYLDPEGSVLSFAGQTNGSEAIYLSSQIAWASNDWHLITLSYSSTNSALYLDDQLATNGLGVTYWPGDHVLTNGFLIGTDSSGMAQARGQFEDLKTFDYPLTATAVSQYFQVASRRLPLQLNGNFNAFSSESGPPNPPGGGGDPGEGSDGTNDWHQVVYGTNDFYLEILLPGTNAFNLDTNSATLILHGTTNDSVYQILSAPTLDPNAIWNWTVEKTFAGADGQNWTPFVISMENQPTRFFIARNYAQDSDGNGLPDWWQLQQFSHLGVDPYADPDGDGWSNIQEFQNGTHPNQFNTPPAPINVTARLDSTGTNVVLTWASGGGPVDHYAIMRNNSVVATVSANAFAFLDGPDYYEFIGGVFAEPSYNVRAYFSNGSHVDSRSVTVSKPRLGNEAIPGQDVTFMRGADGKACLVVAHPPEDLSRIVLSWEREDYSIAIVSIDATNLVNGIVSDISQMEVDGYQGGVYYYQFVTKNGDFGTRDIAFAYYSYEEEGGRINGFTDGRRHIKENLKFLLRSATIEHPFSYVYWEPIFHYPFYSTHSESSTNYEYYGCHQFVSEIDYAKFVELRPVQENFLWRNFVFNTSDFIDDDFDTGAGFDGDFLIRTLEYPKYQYNSSDTNTPPPIAVSTTNSTWLYQRWNHTSPYYDLGAAADIGFMLNNQTNLVLSSSTVRNCYGLPLNSVAIGKNQIIFPGNSVLDWNGDYFVNFAIPILFTEDYYFVSQTRYFNEYNVPRPPLPGSPDFTVTNTSPLLVTELGHPITVAAWAKQAILNVPPSYNGKFAYEEQYFDKAFRIDTNGVATTSSTGVLSPYGEFFPTETGPTALVTMADIESNKRGTGVVHVIALNVDGNHDGIIDFSYTGPDGVSASRPYRFWVNDDNDKGDTTGDDIAGKPANEKKIPNGLDDKVNGVRDLVDFFPVCINIQSLLKALPPGGFSPTTTYRLKQADGALNFVYTDLRTDLPGNYLTDTSLAQSLSDAATIQINEFGATLSTDFLNKISNGGKGVILVEARQPTSQPLVLEVSVGTNVIAQASVPLSITSVEQMFRHKNLVREVYPNSKIGFNDRLSDSDVPNEPETNDKNFVFLHGYNVNPNQARGWFTEMYKRFYWSGSRAKFYGVAYHGFEGQVAGSVTPNLQTNIVHAFESAPKLATFLNSLHGTNILAAHSLGNMVVLSALSDYTNTAINTFFMIDAAVAVEAVDGSAPISTNMIHPQWSDYGTNLWASYWHKLFSTTDGRSQLTWNNRLSNLQSAKIYNFYSSGEEVLREHVGPPPQSVLGTAATALAYIRANLPTGIFTWAWQEKGKGRSQFDDVLSSTHGGWRISGYYAGLGGFLSPANAALLTPAQLIENPFFALGSSQPPPGFDLDLALQGPNASGYAQTNRNRILSDAIPALTLPVGANPVPRLSQQGQPNRNFNMHDEFKNGWPLERATKDDAKWHHSDVREVAYTFIYPMFNEIVNTADLK